MISREARLILYAQGEFAGGSSKTAEGVIRYGRNPITCVVDSRYAGKLTEQIIPGLRPEQEAPIPVVATIEEAYALGADALLLGCAYAGGKLPELWRAEILRALALGLHVVNGLHDFLRDDEEFCRVASISGAQLIELRDPPSRRTIATAKALDVEACTVLTIGTDCSVGKMTASLELHLEAQKRGLRSEFLATGQTGIAIAGFGVPVDRIIGDFMAGAVEDLVLENSSGKQLLFVEGQGSILHPAYSGVTLSILHGCAPRYLILCHRLGRARTTVGDIEIPPLNYLIDTYENIAGYIAPAKVLGIALNTRGFSEAETAVAIEEIRHSTGLACADPVRHGAGALIDPIIEEMANRC